MTGLIILPDPTAGTFQLISTQPVGYGSQHLALAEAFVPFGAFSTRPDPIRRAWSSLEAQRGLEPLGIAMPGRSIRPQATRNAPAPYVGPPAPPRTPANDENRSQGLLGRLVSMLRGGR